MHGSNAGYQTHVRRGDVPVRCEPCRDAASMYRNTWRARKGGLSRRQVRTLALQLLAVRHRRELAWLEEQVEAGRL